MVRRLRFGLALLFGLAVVTWAASVIAQRTTRAWHEHDLALRAQLAISGAERTLISSWRREAPGELQAILTDITRDDRIMAAAACSAEFGLVTQTTEFPPQLACSNVGAQVKVRRSGETRWQKWTAT
ncbi:MAG TPA: hypothetical protein VM580_26645, partial [Labilithrix sp.]|nr:hypothetical protein [Labilithrix sp.]